MPDEISYQHMISTAPTDSKTKYEAMFMWQELPTNDRTVEWNICQHTDCKACGAEVEDNEHMIHACTNHKTIQIRRIASELDYYSSLVKSSSKSRVRKIVSSDE